MCNTGLWVAFRLWAVALPTLGSMYNDIDLTTMNASKPAPFRGH